MLKIPLISLPDKPLAATTQEHLPIADITEDVVLYKDGGSAVIMESTSLNFGLLSEKEQQAVIVAYAALLNSLSFSIQILVRSQKKDLTSYLDYLDTASQKITNQPLASLMANYKHFLAETIKKKNVLGKKFYVVIPFSPLELGVGRSISLITKRGPLPFPKSYIVKKTKIALYPKRDHLIRQAGRLGIKLVQLSTEQIIELIYDIYNSAGASIQAGSVS